MRCLIVTSYRTQPHGFLRRLTSPVGGYRPLGRDRVSGDRA